MKDKRTAFGEWVVITKEGVWQNCLGVLISWHTCNQYTIRIGGQDRLFKENEFELEQRK